MISCAPFYETLYKKGITEYHLIFKQGFSANTLHRMKKGEAINTKTLDALCYAFDCEVGDIIKFVKEKHPFRLCERLGVFLVGEDGFAFEAEKPDYSEIVC